MCRHCLLFVAIAVQAFPSPAHLPIASMGDVEARHNQLVSLGTLPEMAAVQSVTGQISELPPAVRDHVLRQMEVDAEASLAFIRMERQKLVRSHTPAEVRRPRV